MFTGEYLHKLRLRAIRRRALYCLDGLERGILYLSSRLVERVSSPGLCLQLLEIVSKVEEAMRSGFLKHVGSFGFSKLVRMVKTAVKLGSDVAQEWVRDLDFATYLAFMDINS